MLPNRKSVTILRVTTGCIVAVLLLVSVFSLSVTTSSNMNASALPVGGRGGACNTGSSSYDLGICLSSGGSPYYDPRGSDDSSWCPPEFRRCGDWNGWISPGEAGGAPTAALSPNFTLRCGNVPDLSQNMEVSIKCTVHSTPATGFKHTVNIRCAAPSNSGLSCSLNRSSVTPPEGKARSVTLTIKSGVPLGDFQIEVTAKSQKTEDYPRVVTKTVNVNVKVACGPEEMRYARSDGTYGCRTNDPCPGGSSSINVLNSGIRLQAAKPPIPNSLYTIAQVEKFLIDNTSDDPMNVEKMGAGYTYYQARTEGDPEHPPWYVENGIVQKVCTTVDMQVYLPYWPKAEVASPAAQANWKEFLAAALRHENGHVITAKGFFTQDKLSGMVGQDTTNAQALWVILMDNHWKEQMKYEVKEFTQGYHATLWAILDSRILSGGTCNNVMDSGGGNNLDGNNQVDVNSLGECPFTTNSTSQSPTPVPPTNQTNTTNEISENSTAAVSDAVAE